MNKVKMLSLVISILASVQVSFGAVKNVSQSVGGSTSATSQAAGFEAGKAFDGKIDTQWQADDSSTPQILFRDLGKIKTINNITTTFPDVYAYCYSIYVSEEETPAKNLDDTASWKLLIESKVVKGTVTEKVGPVKVRHIATKFENMISNSSFEDTRQAEESQKHGSLVCFDWMREIRDGGTISLDTKIQHSGETSVKMTDEGLASAKGLHLYYKSVKVIPNTTYTYSVYVRVGEGETGMVGLRLDQFANLKTWATFASREEQVQRSKWEGLEVATTKWRKFTFTTETASDCNLVKPGIFYYKQEKIPTNKFWVDDVFLIEGDTETDIPGIVEQEIN